MQQFMRKFQQLNGQRGKVILEHRLFDKQVFYCDCLQTIHDDERAGLVLKGQEKFLYKQDVKVAEIKDKMCRMSDGSLTLTVMV